MAVSASQNRQSRNADQSSHDRRTSFQRHMTPFSIDDILSKRDGSRTSRKRQLSGQREPADQIKVTEVNPSFSACFGGDFLTWNAAIYPKWIQNLQRLYATSAPFLLPRPRKSLNGPQPHSSWVSDFSYPIPGSASRREQSSANFDPWIPKFGKDSRDSSAVRRSTPSPDRASLERARSTEVLKNGVAIHDPFSDSGSNSDEQKDCGTCSFESDDNRKTGNSLSPIHALEKLACSTFQGMEEKNNTIHSIAIGRQVRVKRRKCRTAFTSFQLSVLEQRFNCHKYLTPADRDHIAQALGLSAPQVITWFQNRRAKLKRDLEEMRNDLKTVNSNGDSEEHKAHELASPVPLENGTAGS